MPLPYFRFLLPLFVCSAVVVEAQNIPDLTVTGPAGTVTNMIPPPTLNIYLVPSYLRTYVPKVPIPDAVNINPASNPAEVQISTVYKDGFSRPIQSVQHYALSGSNPHLIQPADSRFKATDNTFLPYPSGTTDYDYNLFANQYNYITGAYPTEGYTGATVTQNISNPAQRATKTFAPGRSQIGQSRGITIKQVTNGAGEIKIWEPDATGKPVLNGTYPAGMLLGEQIYDTMGTLTTTYKDREGRLICRVVKQEDQASGGLAITIYGTTYYVYDAMGNRVCIMPPKATAASASAVSPTVFDNLCFRYQYDDKGRSVAKRTPGVTDFIETVFDPKDRPVMRRTPNGRAAGQWEVTFYDAQGRIKATSLLTDNNSRSSWQNILDAGSGSNNPANLSYYLLTPEGEAAYPGENSISGNLMMTYSYYDNYSLADPGDILSNACNSTLLFTAEALNTLGAETPVVTTHNQGRITGGKIRILPAPGVPVSETGQWRQTASFYDKKGRVVYTVSRDLDAGNIVHAHYTGKQYDYSNRLIYSKHVMQNANGNTTEHKEWNHNEYDLVTGMPTKSWHKTDSGAWVIQTSYSYDAVGRMKREMLGNFGEIRDYSYNIRGQLTGINDYYTRTGDRQNESRSFGESLCYDYGFTMPRYDGKIAGMMWRGAGAALASAYGYSFDYSGRLTNAEYRRYEPPSGTFLGQAWRKDLADYTVSNLKYDLDGNIKKMDQRSVKPSGGLVAMDRLTYTYENGEQSDRLSKVVDSADFYNLGDFNNANGNRIDYDYDPNGNLIKDGNKGITAVTYTHLNKPQMVTFSSGNSIAYSYDATGNKVQENVTEGGITITKDYIGNYIYENNDLQYALSKEGRSVYDKNLHRFTEEYFVKDHLGNVRSVVEVFVPQIQEYFATYEIASANLEGMFFDHMDQIMDERPGGTPGNSQAGNLNGAHADRRIGTSMLLHVMAGDRVEMNVNNFYERYEANNDNPVNAEDMLATIISTLRGGTGGFEGSESHNIKTVTDVFNAGNYGVFDQLLNINADANKPKAYLNYIMFDENMMIVPNMSGAFQANGEGAWTPIGTATPLEFPTNGYLAVYLSNSSKNITADEYGNVYFDQLVIRLSRGTLKEEAHYYPHGLPITGMGSTADNYKENRRKYQGNEYITNVGLDWMDFSNRQYDPQIGRFLGVDPLADNGGQEILSPYSAMANNPLLFVDPDGLENTVYLINRPSSGIGMKFMALLVSNLNDQMAQYGIEVTFKLFQAEMGVEFSMKDISNSDAVVVFGESNDVSNFIQNNLGAPGFVDGSKWGGADYPGSTIQNISGVSVKGVKEDSKNTSNDFMTDLIYTTLHEVGHVRKNEWGMISTPNKHSASDNNVMLWPGAKIRSVIGHISAVDPETGIIYFGTKDERFKNYGDMLQRKYNGSYINSMKAFFDSDYSKDNRLNRHFAPNRPDWYYKTF